MTIPSGRDDRIRTCGILVPNQALYQTEPHPVAVSQQRDLLYSINCVLSTLFSRFFKKILKLFFRGIFGIFIQKNQAFKEMHFIKHQSAQLLLCGLIIYRLFFCKIFYNFKCSLNLWVFCDGKVVVVEFLVCGKCFFVVRQQTYTVVIVGRNRHKTCCCEQYT